MSGNGETPESGFVGRDSELRSLGQALSATAGGNSRMIALTGSAGIGKTSLVEEFLRRSAAGSRAVRWARCPEQSGAPAYWPWTRILGDVIDDLSPAGEKAVAAHLPQLSQIVSRGSEHRAAADDDRDAARFHLFEAVAGVLRQVARETPMVIVLDDLHWADESSLLLLEFLVRDLRSAALLFVVTCREPLPRSTARALGGVLRLARRVSLRGLDREAVARLVAAHDAALPPALVDRLIDTAEGNPFFLAELLHDLPPERAASGEATPRLPLPETVRDAVRRRVEGMGDSELMVLSVAAVIGRQFSASLVAAAAALPPAVVADALEAAARAGVVEPSTGAGDYRFSHALIRETLYEDQRPSERARHHGRIAAALDTRYGDAPDAVLSELSLHYSLAATAGDPARAAHWAQQAGRQAMSQLAYDEAFLHYERADSALVLQGATHAERLRVTLALANAAHAADRDVAAAEAYARVARMAVAAGETTALAQAALGYELARGLFGGVDPRAVELLEKALAAVGEKDSSLRVALLSMLVEALYFSNESERRNAASIESLEMARRLGDPRSIAAALVGRQLALLGLGDLEERRAMADESIAIATATNFRTAAHRARILRVHVLLENGELEGAAHEIHALAANAEQIGRSYHVWQASVPRTALALLAGRMEEATRLAAESTSLRREVRDEAISHVFLLQMVLARGESVQAAALEPSIRSLAERFPGIPTWKAMLAILLAGMGRNREALDIFHAMSAADYDDLPRNCLYPVLLALLAQLAAAFGEGKRAAQLVELLAPFADRNLVAAPFAPGCLGPGSRYLGLALASIGRLDEAVAQLKSALAFAQRMRANGVLPWILRDLVRVLKGRGAPGDAELAESLATGDAGESSAADALRPPSAAVAAPPPSRTMPEADAGDPSDNGISQAVLQRDADVWRVGWNDSSAMLKHVKGFSFLATLISSPSREYHVLDLDVEAPAAGAIGGAEAAEAGLSLGSSGGDSGDMLDAAARAAYRRRLADLREECEEAESFNDPGRAERARAEIEFLATELSRSVGLGGRSRKAGSQAERARQNLSKTIHAAIKRIRAVQPLLGEHLAATIRTGLFCSYEPGARSRVKWTL